MAISGVSVAISQKRYTIWPSALLHTNRKCDSPIIQVFPVLNTFAKFQRGPPVIRGHRIQVGYINLVMLQPRRGVSRNQGCHKCFFQWKTIKPWQTIPHEFYAGGRRRFRPPLARCGNRWPSQTRNQGCHKGFFLVKKYPLAKKNNLPWNLCCGDRYYGCHKCLYSQLKTIPNWNLSLRQRPPPLIYHILPRENFPLPANLLFLLCLRCWRAICLR